MSCPEKSKKPDHQVGLFCLTRLISLLNPLKLSLELTVQVSRSDINRTSLGVQDQC